MTGAVCVGLMGFGGWWGNSDGLWAGRATTKPGKPVQRMRCHRPNHFLTAFLTKPFLRATLQFLIIFEIPVICTR